MHSARTANKGPFGLGGRQLLNRGLGSGVVITADGHIVTNNHVVEGATELAIATPDGTLRPAKVIGLDPDSDLALLLVDPRGLQPIELADVKSLAVGDVLLPIVLAMVKAAIFVGLAYLVGTRLLPAAFAAVARLGSNELFLLAVVATALLTAFVRPRIGGSGVRSTSSALRFAAAAGSLAVEDIGLAGVPNRTEVLVRRARERVRRAVVPSETAQVGVEDPRQ